MSGTVPLRMAKIFSPGNRQKSVKRYNLSIIPHPPRKSSKCSSPVHLSQLLNYTDNHGRRQMVVVSHANLCV